MNAPNILEIGTLGSSVAEFSLYIQNYQELRFWNVHDPSVRDQSGECLEWTSSREPAHLTLSWAMIIEPILAEEISENPCRSANLESFGVFAPIRMIVGSRKKQRYPHE